MILRPDTPQAANADGPVLGLGATADEPVLGLGATADEPVSGLGATADVPVLGLGATADEPVLGLGAIADEPVLGLGATTDVPVAGPSGWRAATLGNSLARNILADFDSSDEDNTRIQLPVDGTNRSLPTEHYLDNLDPVEDRDWSSVSRHHRRRIVPFNTPYLLGLGDDFNEEFPDIITREQRVERGSPILEEIDQAIGGLRGIQQVVAQLSASFHEGEENPSDPSSLSDSESSLGLNESSSSTSGSSSDSESSQGDLSSDDEEPIDDIMAAGAFEAMARIMAAVEAEQLETRRRAAQQDLAYAQQSQLNQAMLQQLNDMQNNIPQAPVQPPVRAALPNGATYSGLSNECYLAWVRKVEDEALVMLLLTGTLGNRHFGWYTMSH